MMFPEISRHGGLVRTTVPQLVWVWLAASTVGWPLTPRLQAAPPPSTRPCPG
jgi:hypothetical protein